MSIVKPSLRALADLMAIPAATDTLAVNVLYNGATFDLERNDVEGLARASATLGVGSESGPDVIAHNAESLLLVVGVTTVNSGGTLTISLQGKDSLALTPAYYTFWTAELPIKAVGTYAYFFANGASGGEYSETQAFGLGPRIWRYQAVVATATIVFSVTYVMGDN